MKKVENNCNLLMRPHVVALFCTRSIIVGNADRRATCQALSSHDMQYMLSYRQTPGDKWNERERWNCIHQTLKCDAHLYSSDSLHPPKALYLHKNKKRRVCVKRNGVSAGLGWAHSSKKPSFCGIRGARAVRGSSRRLAMRD